MKNASSEFGDIYLIIYGIMAFTGLDVGDVLSLTHEQVNIKDKTLIKPRNKSGICQNILMTPELIEIFKNLPHELQKKINLCATYDTITKYDEFDDLYERAKFIQKIDMPECKKCSNNVEWYTHIYCIDCKRMIEAKLGHINDEFKTDFNL